MVTRLKNRIARWRYVYGWRLRYWYLDTPAGARAQVCVFAGAVLVIIVQLIKLAVAAVIPAARQEPQHAIYWWVVQLIIMAVSMIISYATRPKATEPAKQTAESPNTEDGQFAKHHLGTCWVDDSFILSWKPMGTEKIKTKGGKK